MYGKYQCLCWRSKSLWSASCGNLPNCGPLGEAKLEFGYHLHPVFRKKGIKKYDKIHSSSLIDYIQRLETLDNPPLVRKSRRKMSETSPKNNSELRKASWIYSTGPTKEQVRVACHLAIPDTCKNDGSFRQYNIALMQIWNQVTRSKLLYFLYVMLSKVDSSSSITRCILTQVYKHIFWNIIRN